MKLGLVAAFMLLMPAVSAIAAAPEPEGYRGEPYRAAVPDTLTGATVVDTAAARKLWDAGDAVFIDVLPQAPKPSNLPEGTIWRQGPRETIAGAIWLPNVGYEALAKSEDAYFRNGLYSATAGDRSRPLVFFCLDDCWMSWNAAKRALEYGYEAVYWYPEGTDGWFFESYPAEKVRPFEIP